jgi:hypothetical protein
MSMPGDEAQRELERRALRNVRRLVDKLESTDEADAHTQKRIVAALIFGALLLAVVLGAGVVSMRQEITPVAIDPAKLPPVRAGPPR